MQSESDLVRRAQAGDAEAFCMLARAYERRLFVLALHYCRDCHDAEDLSQEVWLKAFRALKSFRGESSFYTWLRHITINTFLNHRRGQGQFDRAIELEEWELSRNEETRGHVSLPPANNLAENIEQDILIERVLGVLAELTPQQRLIFLLKHHEGMTYEEISAALGCSTGTTKKALFRAVRKLREHLGVEVETTNYRPCPAAERG